jgi:hypothetical protein
MFVVPSQTGALSISWSTSVSSVYKITAEQAVRRTVDALQSSPKEIVRCLGRGVGCLLKEVADLLLQVH